MQDKATPGGPVEFALMATIIDRLHRLTVDEYLQAAEGDPAWDRTELIEGVVYDMPPESTLHADAVHAVCRALDDVFPNHRVRATGSVRLSDDSMWDPDVYVASTSTPGPKYPSASDLRLVVEVSVTSLWRDIDAKARGYAASSVPEYWLLVPDVGGYLLRHTNPEGDRYQSIDRVELPRGYEELDVGALFAEGT